MSRNSLVRHFVSSSLNQPISLSSCGFVRSAACFRFRDFVSAVFRFVHSLGPSCISLLLRQIVNFVSLDGTFACSLVGQIVSSIIREFIC